MGGEEALFLRHDQRGMIGLTNQSSITVSLRESSAGFSSARRPGASRIRLSISRMAR
jgi:hypothetical protein